MKIKLTDLNELIVHFNEIFSNKPLLKRRFKIKDIEFGFIPNLENITFGEYVDLEKLFTGDNPFIEEVPELSIAQAKPQSNDLPF